MKINPIFSYCLYWMACAAYKIHWNWAYIKLICKSYSLDQKHQTGMWKKVKYHDE